MYQVYVIKEGDTLESVLEGFDLSYEELKKLNGNFEMIPGNYLVMPKNDFDFYLVKKGDTLYQIASFYGISVSSLALLNGKEEGDYLYEGELLKVPKKGVQIYFTKEGDTLLDLLNYFGTSFSEFFSQNESLVFLPEQLVVYQKNR